MATPIIILIAIIACVVSISLLVIATTVITVGNLLKLFVLAGEHDQGLRMSALSNSALTIFTITV